MKPIAILAVAATILPSSFGTLASEEDRAEGESGRSADWTMTSHRDEFFDRAALWVAYPEGTAQPLVAFSCHLRYGCTLVLFGEPPLPDGWEKAETPVLVRVDDGPVQEFGGDLFVPSSNTDNLYKMLALMARGGNLRLRIYPSPEDREMNRNGVTVTQSLKGFRGAVDWVFERFMPEVQHLAEVEEQRGQEP